MRRVTEQGGLDSFARVRLLFGPSPVPRLERLTEHLGGEVEIWTKREDRNSGLAYGGNKTRKLEYLVAAKTSAGSRPFPRSASKRHRCPTPSSTGRTTSAGSTTPRPSRSRAGSSLRRRFGLAAELLRRALCNSSEETLGPASSGHGVIVLGNSPYPGG
jgi:hypothetical protein